MRAKLFEEGAVAGAVDEALRLLVPFQDLFHGCRDAFCTTVRLDPADESDVRAIRFPRFQSGGSGGGSEHDLGLTGLSAGIEGLDLALHEGGRVDQDARLADGLGARLAVAGLVLLPTQVRALETRVATRHVGAVLAEPAAGLLDEVGSGAERGEVVDRQDDFEIAFVQALNQVEGEPLETLDVDDPGPHQLRRLGDHLDRVGAFSKIENPCGALGPDLQPPPGPAWVDQGHGTERLLLVEAVQELTVVGEALERRRQKCHVEYQWIAGSEFDPAVAFGDFGQLADPLLFFGGCLVPILEGRHALLAVDPPLITQGQAFLTHSRPHYSLNCRPVPV